MKMHLVLILWVLGSEWAHGVVQTSLNQDKPPYISMDFSFGQSGSYARDYQISPDTLKWNGTIGGSSTGGGGFWEYSDNYTGFSSGIDYWWMWPNPNYTVLTYMTWNSNLGNGQPTVTTNSGITVFSSLGQCWNSCFSTNGVDFAYYYNGSMQYDHYTLQENDSAHATAILHTGGKAISKCRNLISFSVSSAYGTALDFGAAATAAAGYYFVGEQVVAIIPPQNFFVGNFGPLNSNYYKYVSVPDNSAVDVTPHPVGIAGATGYYFYLGQPQKYHSYFEIYVEQPNPGYSLIPISDPLGAADTGHESWGLRTDAPSDALRYISTNLTAYLGVRGFYPGTNGSICSSDPGQVQNDATHPFNVKRTFYIGFPNLLNALEYVRGESQSPPAYCWSGINCVALAIFTGEHAGIYALPQDESPQNSGAMLVEMYPGPFFDTNDVFYAPF